MGWPRSGAQVSPLSQRERLLKTFGETFVSKQWKTNNWIFFGSSCSHVFAKKKVFSVRLEIEFCRFFSFFGINLQ